MGTLDNHSSNTTVKMLVAAESGTGKTGALASLVDAGYRLRVLDFDNGLSPLKSYIKDKSKLSNVSYATLQDKLGFLPGTRGPQIIKADGFIRGLALLDKWNIDGQDLGPISKWTAEDVLVIDSLTFMGQSALRQVLKVANRTHPEIQDWGLAMAQIEDVLAMTYSAEATPCNVVVLTHIQESKNGKTTPNALGDKLGPKVGRYFDNLVSIQNLGGKRQFTTKANGTLTCKVAAPMPDTLPIETGMADLFAYLTGKRKYTTSAKP